MKISLTHDNFIVVYIISNERKNKLYILNYQQYIKGMRKWLNNYFNLSKREFNGLLVLVALIHSVLLTPAIYSWLMPFQPDKKEERKAIAELNKADRKCRTTGINLNPQCFCLKALITNNTG